MSFFGVFGPDNESSETLLVRVNLSRTNNVKSFFLGDIWNTNEFFMKDLGSGFVYSGCTIPELLPLNPNDTIRINFTGDPLFLDYIAITTEPNPHGVPFCSNTEMKCGWFTDNEFIKTIIGRSCNVTTPIPQRALCGNLDVLSGDCVYGSESGTPPPENECYTPCVEGDSCVVVNANGTSIRCRPEIQGHWCPINFQWHINRQRCEPNPNLCDYGSAVSTRHNCTYYPSEGQPGFMNDVVRCLNNFYPPGNEPGDGPEWHIACCEFLRVARAGLPDYLFFHEKNVRVY